MKRFDKILIANRGEIALRIMKTAGKLGISTVVVYTDDEAESAYVKYADEAWSLGKGDLKDTYLNIQKIIDIGIKSGAQAVHPGYGFLSENPDFAKACENANLVFIGPSEEVLRTMGNKIKAKEIAKQAGVNVLESVKFEAGDIGSRFSNFKFPVLIKAAHGGGGKGMLIADSVKDLADKAKMAARSALSYFGNGEIFVEEYIPDSRHVEVQILGDQFGNIIHLFERDCTAQRNHQKIIEEAPAAFLDESTRKSIHNAAMAICKKIDYQNAGTVEFLVDKEENFFFLEMNPRIQVEHPVSEEITGVDIVEEQLSIAAGNPLNYKQKDIKIKGHSIECRIYAEDPLSNFLPSGNKVNFVKWPDGDVRLESDLENELGLGSQFDPLLGKIIVKGVDRDHAILKMEKFLKETYVSGPKTNTSFLAEIFRTDQFRKNELTTTFCEVNIGILTDSIVNKRKSIDHSFLIAAAVKVFYNKPSLDVNSFYQKIGHWRIFNTGRLKLDDENYFVDFESIDNHLIIYNGDQKFDAVIHKDYNNFLEIEIEDKIQKIFYYSENNNKVVLGINACMFEVYSDNFLDPDRMVKNNQEEIEFGENLINSHLFGKIININVKADQEVEKGEVLLVIESMKSENAIVSPKKAKIKKLIVTVGTQVTDQMPLVYLEDI